MIATVAVVRYSHGAALTPKAAIVPTTRTSEFGAVTCLHNWRALLGLLGLVAGLRFGELGAAEEGPKAAAGIVETERLQESASWARVLICGRHARAVALKDVTVIIAEATAQQR